MNNFQQQINKTNSLNVELKDYYGLNFYKFCEKIKIKIKNNNPFQINYDQEIKIAKELKEKRIKIQWNNNYLKDNDKEEKEDNDMDLNDNVNENDYNPILMKFGSLNYVNININLRKQIVYNYGNKHDIINFKAAQQTIYLEQRRNKNKNWKRNGKRGNNKYKRNNNNNNKNKFGKFNKFQKRKQYKCKNKNKDFR